MAVLAGLFYGLPFLLGHFTWGILHGQGDVRIDTDGAGLHVLAGYGVLLAIVGLWSLSPLPLPLPRELRSIPRRSRVRTGVALSLIGALVWSVGVPVVNSRVNANSENPTINSRIRLRLQTQGVIQQDPVVAGSLILAASSDGNLYAVDIRTGAKRWQSPYGGTETAPLRATANTALVRYNDGNIIAVDVRTGRRLWQRRSPYYQGTASEDHISPIAAGRSLYLVEYERLRAIDARTGRVRWSKYARSSNRVLAADEKHVYMTDDDFIFALDASNGRRRWVKKAANSRFQYPSLATLAYEKLYVLSERGKLWADHALTGRKAWESQDGEELAKDLLAVANNTVCAANQGFGGGTDIHAFSARNGKERWRLKPPGDVKDIVASAKFTYLTLDGVENRGRLVALSAATGEEAWQFQANSEITAATASRGAVYAGTEAGSLFALTAAASSK